MSRIRTIKPDFFRHEELQELGAEAMLVFAGLWTQCDAQGIFEDRPRQLKLDILPFMDFDMDMVLATLEGAGLLVRYQVDGKRYGLVLTFTDHQRISGKEAGEAGKKHPLPDQCQGNKGEAPGKQLGSIRDELESQEEEKEKERITTTTTGADTREPDDPLAAEVVTILLEVPGYARSTGMRPRHAAEVFDEFPEIPRPDWPKIARSLRDERLESPAMKENSVFAASPAGDLRKYVPKWLTSQARGQPTPTRAPSRNKTAMELLQSALAEGNAA